ncbi:MAG: hypothetical protein HFJ24_08120 [Clostridia bacterium]|nr:hypothetical protein [Clostridia bacterium]
MRNKETKVVNQEKGITAIALVVITLIAIMLIIIMVNTFRKKEPENVGPVQGEEQGIEQEEYVQILQDGSKLNKSEELLKEKKLDELEISNIQLKETGGITTLLADVKNNTNHEIQERDVTIEVLDKYGNVITRLNGVIDTVGAGEKVQLNMSVTGDVANAYDFRIK